MVNKRQKTEMMDYLVHRLSQSGLRAEPRRRELLTGSDLETGYILIGKNEGIVLLIDQVYPHDTFKKIYNGIRQQIPAVATVIFKDGKTFFRSGVAGVENTGIKSKIFKSDEDHSLKNYREVMSQIISMRPEELFVSRDLGRWVQYYQPQSERLEQALVSYKFIPVELDYSHIPDDERFGPLTRESERLSIWTERKENTGPLFLNYPYLSDRPAA